MTEEAVLKNLRKQIFLMSYAAGTGHLASAYSCLELLYTLYKKDVLRVTPQTASSDDRDKLILSKGHGSLALYAVLAEACFLEKESLMTFARPNSILGGEPNRLEIPGVEATTGSLGHGLSIGAGIAYADKLSGRNAKTYVILGDGECQEGSVWEAAMAAGKLKLSNLVVIVDLNRIQKMGSVKDTIGFDGWDGIWSSFGFDARHVNGHDTTALASCFSSLAAQESPCAVLADTVKGHGVSIMEHNPAWHWKQPNKKELKKIAEELMISQEELDYAKSLH